MKLARFFHIFVVILWLMGNVLAQNNDLNISLKPLSNAKTDWEFTLEAQLSFTPENGIVFQVPVELMVVPVSITVNGNKFWMQNLLTVPEKDSVVAWQIVPEGLMLLFKKGIIRRGDKIKLVCIANILKKKFKSNKVFLKKIVFRPDGLKVSSQPLASGTLPAIPNR